MQTVPSTSRFHADRITFRPGVESFGPVSGFLRGAIADEDARLLSDSMRELALHSESVVAVLRQSRHRDLAAPLLMDMLTVVRDHRTLVLGLGLAWRGLYEYAGYLQGLNNFRVLIGQWLLHSAPWDEQLHVTAEDFELVAWRTLGDGVLLIDVYEQWQQADPPDSQSRLAALGPPQVERVLQWWQKLRR